MHVPSSSCSSSSVVNVVVAVLFFSSLTPCTSVAVMVMVVLVAVGWPRTERNRFCIFFSIFLMLRLKGRRWQNEQQPHNEHEKKNVCTAKKTKEKNTWNFVYCITFTYKKMYYYVYVQHTANCTTYFVFYFFAFSSSLSSCSRAISLPPQLNLWRVTTMLRLWMGWIREKVFVSKHTGNAQTNKRTRPNAGKKRKNVFHSDRGIVDCLSVSERNASRTCATSARSLW